MNMRIPFKISAEGVKNTNEAGSEFHGHIILMKQAQNYTSDSRKEKIEQRTVGKKKVTKNGVDGKNAMAVIYIDKFKGHFGGTFDGVKITAGRTKTAFTSERNGFDLSAMFTTVDSTAVAIVPAMYHLIDVFVYGIAYFDIFGFKLMKVFLEDLLKYIHNVIIQQLYEKLKQNYPSRLRGRGVDAFTLF